MRASHLPNLGAIRGIWSKCASRSHLRAPIPRCLPLHRFTRITHHTPTWTIHRGIASATDAPSPHASILGFGNPVLDISAVVDQRFLDEWGLELNNAILADERHASLYERLIATHAVEYIAGGSTQNTIRVAQWMASGAASTAFVGCVGRDAWGEQLEAAARADGVRVAYMRHATLPTGTCAVLVSGGERSLCARLAAAAAYAPEHFASPQVQALLHGAQIVYAAGFFLTVSPSTVVAVGKHCVASGKACCINLSATFIPQQFKAALDEAMYYCDFVFGNEKEAAAYGVEQGWGDDVKEVALQLAALPKASEATRRCVVITQGKEPTLVAYGGVVTEYEVPLVPKEKLVDTNGAGDAFVGGFLALLSQGSALEDCVRAGQYASSQIVQMSGCKIPSAKPTFVPSSRS
mmetsp:Transcript_32900/g.81949  ORF Transcript_32900/g.81949 Transcript_32900/m.81949 type:complete len:407 (-) Transcript_32900:305-1525(-)